MSARRDFIEDWLRGLYTMTELCARYFERRRVSRNGGIRWHSAWVNVSHVLAEDYVGLEEVADGVWAVYFGPVLLGRFDERDGRIHGAHNRNKL